jgi:hypothetical protein
LLILGKVKLRLHYLLQFTIGKGRFGSKLL